MNKIFLRGYLYKEGEGEGEFDSFKFDTMQKSLADLLKRYYENKGGVKSYVQRAQNAWEELEPEYRPSSKPTLKAYKNPIDIKYPLDEEGKNYLRKKLGAAGLLHYRRDRTPELIIHSPGFSNTLEHELTHNVHMGEDLNLFRERWKKYLDFQKRKKELKKELYKKQNSKHIKQINKVFDRLGETFDTDISWWDKLLFRAGKKKYLTNKNEIFARAAEIKRHYEKMHPGEYITDSDKAEEAADWFINKYEGGNPQTKEEVEKAVKYLEDPEILYKAMPAV